jgi:hypothetical protein
VPRAISSCRLLNFLDLIDNKLFGLIVPELVDLNVSHNALIGEWTLPRFERLLLGIGLKND